MAGAPGSISPSLSLPPLYPPPSFFPAAGHTSEKAEGLGDHPGAPWQLSLDKGQAGLWPCPFPQAPGHVGHWLSVDLCPCPAAAGKEPFPPL